MSYNVPEVAEPAPPTRFQVLHTSTLAVLLPGSIRSWPVGTEAASSGLSQQLFCYRMGVVLDGPSLIAIAQECSAATDDVALHW